MKRIILILLWLGCASLYAQQVDTIAYQPGVTTHKDVRDKLNETILQVNDNWDTLQLKLDIADTSTLSNRINLKLNIADTSTLSARIDANAADIDTLETDTIDISDLGTTVVLKLDSVNSSGYTSRSDFNKSQFGLYNILDYGAVSNDGNTDHTAIQSAINAAYAVGGATEGQGATVKIPAGIWYITAPDTLKSDVHIDIDNGAYFYFPANYDSAMWVVNGTKLHNCKVRGGYYYCSTRTYDFIDLTSTGTANYILGNSFQDMFVYNAGIGIDLATSSDGWINGNVFNNIYINLPISAIKTRQGAGTLGLDGNLFSNINIQTNGTTDFAIDSLSGDYNQFVNMMIWDLTGSTVSANLASTAQANMLMGYGIKALNYVDNGSGNFIIDAGHMIIPDSLKIKGLYAHRAVVDKLAIHANTDNGSVATPDGSVGIKIQSLGTETATPTVMDSENKSVRIVARNSSAENYGSYMYFQTHGDASGATYNDVMGLMSNKGVVYPPVLTGTVGTGMVYAELGRITYYNEAASSDLSANPQIVAGYDGQIMTIIGSSDTNTLILEDGNGLQLAGGVTCTLGAGDTITLIYISALSVWVEQSRSDN